MDGYKTECQIVYWYKNLLAKSTVFSLVEKSEGRKAKGVCLNPVAVPGGKGKKDMQSQTYPPSPLGSPMCICQEDPSVREGEPERLVFFTLVP